MWWNLDLAVFIQLEQDGQRVSPGKHGQAMRQLGFDHLLGC